MAGQTQRPCRANAWPARNSSSSRWMPLAAGTRAATLFILGIGNSLSSIHTGNAPETERNLSTGRSALSAAVIMGRGRFQLEKTADLLVHTAAPKYDRVLSY